MRVIKIILRVLGLSILLLCLFVPQHNAAPSPAALEESTETLSTPFWKKPWDWVSHKASDVYNKIEDATANLPSWDRIASFGSGLLKQADEDLSNAIKQWPIKEDVESFRATLQELLYSANAIRADFAHVTEKKGLTFEDISDELGAAFQAVLEELKEAFPPPDQAPSHEARQNMTRTTLQKIEQALLDFARKHDVPEDRVEALLVSFGKLVPIVEKLVVITGDLAEQHPVLLGTLLCTVTASLIPESWFLRPLLSLFGFGPYGPVKGTSAAWAQRAFWGAAVKKGSWFSALQRTGMKGMVLRKAIGGIGAGIGVGAGALC